MKFGNFFNSLIMTLAIAGLAACGGGGGGSSGSSGQAAASSGSTVVGVIGGFGSVILSNGVEYDTDNVTTCEVDDVSASGVCEDSLDVGMTISMQVDGSGAATSIKYDDDLEGPAANVSGTDGQFNFDVFGASVMTTSPDTQWRDFNTNPPLAAELDGANVEVSGEWQGSTLNARYVEKQSDSTHEAKGTVGVVTGSTFPLTLNDGTVIDVDATNSSLLPQAGDYVEVKGTFDGVTFLATEVELEDEDDFDSDGEAEITGTLSANADSSTGSSIGNTDVDISEAPSCEGLAGSMVEAEGTYDESTGVLLVEKCKDEDDDLEMKCLLSSSVSSDDTMPKVGSLVCTFPGADGTLPIEFRNMPDLAVFSGDDRLDPFDLSSVNSGDCVEIKASTDDSGTHVAGLIELESVASACESYQLEGPVDAFTDNVSITVLGVTFIVDGTTAYPDGKPVTGDLVKIIDAAGDGIADTVKIED